MMPGKETYVTERQRVSIGSCVRCLLAIWCVVGLIVSCSNDIHEDTSNGDDSGLVSNGPLDPQILRMRESLVEDVGIETVLRVDELVADHMDEIFLHTRYRTGRDMTAALHRREEMILAPDADHRAIRFELEVSQALLSANDSRTGDIAEDDGLLHDAFEAALAECAIASGIEDVSLLLHPSRDDWLFTFFDSSTVSEGSPIEERSTEELWSQVDFAEFLDEDLWGESGVEVLDEIRRTAERHDQVAASLGLTSDELLDLRQTCSRYAATLPTLDPSLRQEVMTQLRDHYLVAAYSQAATNPP